MQLRWWFTREFIDKPVCMCTVASICVFTGCTLLQIDGVIYELVKMSGFRANSRQAWRFARALANLNPFKAPFKPFNIRSWLTFLYARMYKLQFHNCGRRAAVSLRAIYTLINKNVKRIHLSARLKTLTSPTLHTFFDSNHTRFYCNCADVRSHTFTVNIFSHPRFFFETPPLPVSQKFFLHFDS